MTVNIEQIIAAPTGVAILFDAYVDKRSVELSVMTKRERPLLEIPGDEQTGRWEDDLSEGPVIVFVAPYGAWGDKPPQDVTITVRVGDTEHRLGNVALTGPERFLKQLHEWLLAQRPAPAPQAPPPPPQRRPVPAPAPRLAGTESVRHRVRHELRMLLGVTPDRITPSVLKQQMDRRTFEVVSGGVPQYVWRHGDAGSLAALARELSAEESAVWSVTAKAVEIAAPIAEELLALDAEVDAEVVEARRQLLLDAIGEAGTTTATGWSTELSEFLADRLERDLANFRDAVGVDRARVVTAADSATIGQFAVLAKWVDLLVLQLRSAPGRDDVGSRLRLTEQALQLVADSCGEVILACNEAGFGEVERGLQVVQVDGREITVHSLIDSIQRSSAERFPRLLGVAGCEGLAACRLDLMRQEAALSAAADLPALSDERVAPAVDELLEDLRRAVEASRIEDDAGEVDVAHPVATATDHSRPANHPTS